MKRAFDTFVSGMIAVAILSASACNVNAQWETPELVNQLIAVINAPVLAPGENATLAIDLCNPFSSAINNVSLRAEPYRIVYENGASDWNGVVDRPKLINLTADSSTINISTMLPEERKELRWTVITTEKTSHGGLFAQSVYFVRLALSFDSSNQHISYASKGFFTADQWNKLTDSGTNDSTVFNYSYLSGLGYKGIIPDVSFTVRDEIPLWPAALMLGAACVTGLVAVYYHLKIDPMFAPRLYRILVAIKKKIEHLAPRRRRES